MQSWESRTLTPVGESQRPALHDRRKTAGRAQGGRRHGLSSTAEQCRQCKHEGSGAGAEEEQWCVIHVWECGRVSAATVSGESVVAVGVDREGRIVVKKVGCAQRCRGLNFVKIVSPQFLMRDRE